MRIFIIKVIKVYTEPSEIGRQGIVIRQEALDIKIAPIAKANISKLICARVPTQGIPSFVKV
mgnify:CR=1 FL=1